MSKKNVILILVVIIVVVIVVNINKNESNQIAKKQQYSDFDKTTLVGNKKIEDEISSAILQCKSLYQGIEDFYTYFKVEFINRYMGNSDRIVLVEDIEKEDFSIIDIYDLNGNLLQDFPKEKISNVTPENLVIEPNTDMLIKLYSKADTTTYYYTLNISDTGEYKLTPICYTVGQNDDSKIIWEEEDIENANK